MKTKKCASEWIKTDKANSSMLEVMVYTYYFSIVKIEEGG